MKVENKVCTIEQAKRLQELGVDGNSTNHYYTHPLFGAGEYRLMMLLNPKEVNAINAYDVSELGVMLPSETYTIRTGSDGSFYPQWEWTDEGNQKAMGVYDTEAQARAAMLIYLLENNLTTAAEVNERLANA